MRIYKIGIRLNSLKLYKKDRKLFLKVAHEILYYGVLQGTVFDPILFNSYINGLFSVQSCIEIIFIY